MTSGTPTSIILGTAQLVQSYGVTRDLVELNDLTKALNFLDFANQMGIRTIDTAPAYGSAESVIGMSRSSFSIHTKVAKDLNPEQSLRRSLTDLGKGSVDVLYLHDSDAFLSDPVRQTQELARCRDAGASRIGVSIYDVQAIPKILDIQQFDVVQFPLNVLDRGFLEWIPRLVEAGITCIARSIFLQGVLLSSPDDLPKQVVHLTGYVRDFCQWCDHHSISPLEASLAFVASIAGVDAVIVGTSDTEELAAIIRAEKVISSRELDRESLLSLPAPDRQTVDPRRWN